MVVRLDPGDEIITCLTALQEREHLGFAQVSGLAAVGEAEIGVFDTVKKQFRGNTFRGSYEVAHLAANLTMKDGMPYVHAHIVIADETGAAFGGHLVRAVISATAELYIQGLRDIRPGLDVDRRFDQTVGLNLLRFPEERSGGKTEGEARRD